VPLPPHLFPRTGRRADPAVTPPTGRACKSGRAVLLAPGIVSPRKLPVKGAPCGRVPPLRSGQTLDRELPRQKTGTCQEDGESEGTDACT
jgi:hypothetical protein